LLYFSLAEKSDCEYVDRNIETFELMSQSIHEQRANNDGFRMAHRAQSFKIQSPIYIPGARLKIRLIDA